MPKLKKACKFCGEPGLQWLQVAGGWRLSDPGSGLLHTCNPSRATLMAQAGAHGMPPTVAATMRTRDLMDWLSVNGANAPEPDEPLAPGIPDDVQTLLNQLQPVVAQPEPPKPDLPEGFAHVHPNYYLALRYAQAVPSANQWWAGPAGSGKTTLAACIAKALGKTLYVVAISKNTAEFDLFGYMDGHGRYVPGKLYEPLRATDALVLIDECDRGTDGVLVALNAVLDQRTVQFPNGERVNIDPSVMFVASGNTWGRGADAVYSAASQLDAAFLDRFQFKLSHDYDEQFELNISPRADWTRHVQKVRKAVFDLKLQGVVISPRAARDGGAAIAAGIPWAQVEKDVLWSAIPVDLQPAVKQRMGLNVAA